MAVRIYHWHPSDEDQVVGQPQKTFFAEDQNAEWWVGQFQTGALTALSLAQQVANQQSIVAETTVDLWQDDPAGNLTATVDEYFWQNPTAPVPGTLGPLYLPDPEEIPAASLTATVDEYYWEPLVQPVPMVLGPIYLPDPEEIPAANLTATVDEYFWQNPGSMVWTLGPLYLPDPEEIPAADLTATVDEYFWQQPPPLTWKLGPLYLPDPEEIPAADLTATVDEYYWEPLVPPVSWQPPIQAMSASDEDSYPQFVAATNQPDEDFWQNPVPLAPAVLGPLYLPDPEEIPAASLTATVDEYFWQNPAAPWPWTLGPLYQPDPEEIPAGSLRTQLDEDFWQNPVPTVWNIWNISLPYLPDVGDVIVAQPVQGTTNYINAGAHNYINQEVGGGIKF